MKEPMLPLYLAARITGAAACPGTPPDAGDGDGDEAADGGGGNQAIAGGGVYIHSAYETDVGAQLLLDANVSFNTATTAGGVYVANGATLDRSAASTGLIQYNTSINPGGGVICAQSTYVPSTTAPPADNSPDQVSCAGGNAACVSY